MILAIDTPSLQSLWQEKDAPSIPADTFGDLQKATERQQANKDAATAPIGGGTSQDQRNEVGSCTKKTCMRCLKIYVYITCHLFHECRVWVFDAVYKCWVMIYPFWVFLYKLKRLVSNPVRPSNRLRNSSTVFCRKPERSEGWSGTSRKTTKPTQRCKRTCMDIFAWIVLQWRM